MNLLVSLTSAFVCPQEVAFEGIALHRSTIFFVELSNASFAGMEDISLVRSLRLLPVFGWKLTVAYLVVAKIVADVGVESLTCSVSLGLVLLMWDEFVALTFVITLMQNYTYSFLRTTGSAFTNRM